MEEKKVKTTYTVKEIQMILNISAPTAYKLAKSGVFRAVKFDNTIRISKESFDDWLNSNLSSVRLEKSHPFAGEAK